jgi:hypothetical protein
MDVLAIDFAHRQPRDLGAQIGGPSFPGEARLARQGGCCSPWLSDSETEPLFRLK